LEKILNKMKLVLRTLSASKKIKNKPVLMRVDWNVPISSVGPSDSLKIERNIDTIKQFQKRGAKLILLTHIGRPKTRDRKLSTKRLVPLLKKEYGVDLIYHAESVSKVKDLEKLKARIEKAESGTIHLLENVRFEKGEEKNDVKLVKQYASLADIFVNDAFAVCHRKQASVLGLARAFKQESYAGPALVEEVKNMLYILNKPKKPFIAIIGGKKLSTKIPVLKSLLKICDTVVIGGAMATPFFKLNGMNIGKSFIEKEVMKSAKSIMKSKKTFLLPIDVMTVKSVHRSSKRVYKNLEQVESSDIIVDAGPATLAKWAIELRKAKTILWNGPIGVTEIHEMGFGSRFIARVMASRSHLGAWTLSGGGDTIPVILNVHAEKDLSFVSTGGGAMLEFITEKGLLPGLQPLLK